MFGATKLAALVAISAVPAVFASSLRSLKSEFAMADCSAQENGVDYVGNDLTSRASTTSDGCCGICKGVSGCNAYSWTNQSGGTCYLKTAKTATANTAGVISAQVTSTQPTCPGQENNVDYVGNDLTSQASTTADGCCGICKSVSGCNAFSWTNQNGGTCYLKTAKTTTASKAGVISAQVNPNPPTPTAPPAPVCNAQETGVDYVGNDLTNKPSPNAGGCCQVCKDTVNCRAYTWTNQNGGTCYLKNGKTATASNGNVISATLIAKCNWEYGVDYLGNDIGKALGAVDSCCGKCSDFPGCKAYSWNAEAGGTCYFKSAKGQTSSNAAVISSVVYY